MPGSEDKKLSMTPIVVAVIGLCGTVMIGVFGFAQFWLPYQESIKGTQTAISRTQVASSDLSQPSEEILITPLVVPTDTIPPPPTETMTPTPTDTAIPPTPTPTDTLLPTNTPQPETIDILADQDRFWHGAYSLVACLANSKYCHYNEQELFLSYCPRNDSNCQKLGFGEIGIRFLITNIPNNVCIGSAYLSGYIKSTTKSEFSVLVSRADSPWSEETSAAPQCTSDSIRFTGVVGWNTWDISSIIEFQHDNPSLNYGICLVVDEDVTLIFASRESANPPRVRVTYLP